jgi:hypothetical protein
MKRTFMSAVLLATLGLSAAQAQVCNGHDGPIQSFASGTAQWPGIDFGLSVATMSNVAVNLVEASRLPSLLILVSQERTVS